MTLLELLVGLVLLGLTGVLIAQAFALTDRVIDRTGERGAVLPEEFEAGATLRRLLEAAVPPYGPRAEAAFEGTRRSLSFEVRPGMLSGGTVRRVTVEHDGARRGLVLSVSGEGPTARAESLTLLPGVEDLRLRYLSRAPSGEWRWSDEWQGAEQLPELVELRAMGRAGEARLSLRSRLGARYSTACIVFDLRDCVRSSPQ